MALLFPVPCSLFPTEAGPDWAGPAAEHLLALVPTARMALCQLDGTDPAVTAVRTTSDGSPPDYLAALQSDAAQLEGIEGTVHPAPALGALFGFRCLATSVRDERGSWAFLALGVPVDAAPEVGVLAASVLSVFAQSLSLWRRSEAARCERDEFAGFALAGQATVGLAHELNNLLNSVVLQASVIQLQVDETFHAGLDVIRRQVNQATGLLRPLGQLSSERAKTFYPVDLAGAVQEVLREQPALAGRMAFSTALDTLPPVRASTSSIKQLVFLLLSGVSAGAAAPLQVRVEKQGRGVQLLIEADRAADGVNGDFVVNADSVLWQRLGDLERLAGQSLVRQLEGALQVEASPLGGFRVRVCWN